MQAIYETGTPVVIVSLTVVRSLCPGSQNTFPPCYTPGCGEEGCLRCRMCCSATTIPAASCDLDPFDVGRVVTTTTGLRGRSHWKGDYVEMSAKPLYPLVWADYTASAMTIWTSRPADGRGRDR